MNVRPTSFPYYPISEHYIKTFGQKVYKIPIVTVNTCPNRMGLKNMKPCVFCDEWGSAAHEEAFQLNLIEQIQKYRQRISNNVNAFKFLIYFQAYTSTFTKIKAFNNQITQALQFPDVVGIVIGTRPDCISSAALNIFEYYSTKTYFSVEIGVQSIFDHHLSFLQRGHQHKSTKIALKKLSEFEKLNIGIHLIFGLPNETDNEIIQTAQWINSMPIHNVKLHNLHVLKNTPLAELFSKKLFKPLELDEYTYRVSLFLQHLSPQVAVHRLSAIAARQNELIAPQWTKEKMMVYQHILNYLNSNQIIQGQFMNSN